MSAVDDPMRLGTTIEYHNHPCDRDREVVVYYYKGWQTDVYDDSGCYHVGDFGSKSDAVEAGIAWVVAQRANLGRPPKKLVLR